MAGVYGAAGVSGAIGRGAGAIVLTNQNGAVLTLSGRSAGLIVSADLNGLGSDARAKLGLRLRPRIGSGGVLRERAGAGKVRH